MKPLQSLLYRKPLEIKDASLKECAAILHAKVVLDQFVRIENLIHPEQIEQFKTNRPFEFKLFDKNGILITTDISKGWRWLLHSIDQQLNGCNQQREIIMSRITEVMSNQYTQNLNLKQNRIARDFNQKPGSL